MKNQMKQNLAKQLEQILVDWEDDSVCSPHLVSDKVSGAMRPILERLYDVAGKLSAKDEDMIAVVNAYTKLCYGWFATDEVARNYMRNMLLKEPESHVEVCEFADHWIWVYDARGTEHV